MPLVFGLDIGTTSIGFAVIEHDVECATGKIHRLGVRIFPEARDAKGVPLNQERRQARLRRRQLRRRRERRRVLADQLSDAGLLPSHQSVEWHEIMKLDPYDLRRRAFDGEPLVPHEVGRAIYHLAQRRHFKGRDMDEVSDEEARASADDKEAKSSREETVRALKGKSLGAWLSTRGPHERKRGEHATREVVEEEFYNIWESRIPKAFRDSVRNAIFFQRPVFWRPNTLGECRFVPGARPCPKGYWFSQQRRMLEKLNNLSLAGGNQRRLDEEERRAILATLQTQASMTWAGVRSALRPLYRSRGELGELRTLRFNLEEGGEGKLLGNAVEAKLARIFGHEWQDHPRKQEIRESIPHRLWQADYREMGNQRVVILPESEREQRRKAAVRQLKAEFGLSDDQGDQISRLKRPSGWDSYSIEALRAMLPQLEAGARLGEIINGPDWEDWRNATFPDREQPTDKVFGRLPSPADREEGKHIAALRNPTVARTRNELRKVVNNLVDMFGKPDLIRVEVARDVGLSKSGREEKTRGIRRREGRRSAARKALQERKIPDPSRADVEKWMLWEECGYRCPYTGDCISFDGLFRTGEFDVEHIWPRSKSLDDSFANKTLCRRDVNAKKGNRTPYEFLSNDPEGWAALVNRLDGMKAPKGRTGMSLGKIRRFRAPSIPDGFASRQLNDTGYAAREAVAYLKKLWPDVGQEGPVRVFAVSGRVTAYLRRLWGLNNILADNGEKTRADHRHHAVDALTVACCHQGMTQRLALYWQDDDNPLTRQTVLPPPWRTIRRDAKKEVAGVVVSHRVRRKLSGALHRETVYGDTGKDGSRKGKQPGRYFVTRKKLETLSKDYLREENSDWWPDQSVRAIVTAWVNRNGGDPKKAFPPYPKRGGNGPEIRKVRVRIKRQVELMAPVSTGYATLGNNHHIAIYRRLDGVIEYEVVALLEATRRLTRREPVVRRERSADEKFLMSLSPGDSLQLVTDGEKEVRVVTSLWSDGRVVVNDHKDASDATVSRLSPKVIVANGWKKISVDPIGRVRPSND